MKSILFAAAAVLSLGLATTANAAPVSGQVVPSDVLKFPVETIAYAVTPCRSYPNGWFYINNRGEKLLCNPRPRGVFYVWRVEGSRAGWYHRGYRRWH
jgi:hypothetical protein